MRKSKQPLSPTQAQHRIQELETEIRGIRQAREDAVRDRNLAKAALWEALPVARLNSPEYETPLRAMEEADETIKSCDRKIAYRERDIRNLTPIAYPKAVGTLAAI